MFLSVPVCCLVLVEIVSSIEAVVGRFQIHVTPLGFHRREGIPHGANTAEAQGDYNSPGGLHGFHNGTSQTSADILLKRKLIFFFFNTLHSDPPVASASAGTCCFQPLK